MGTVRAPRSLRANAATNFFDERLDGQASRKVSAVAGLVAVASFSSGAEAQQSNLPPVSVDAPVARPKPAASAPTPDQIRARNALRRAARRQQQQAKPEPAVAAPALAPDRDRYADPAAPYKGDRIQASGKFPEPLLNTPKTVTVLTKDVLEDKNATTLKQAILSTAGVTLGSGEGGNAFGDRFFIRGFDARNDVFIDGVRDPGVSVRENFFTEQVEILRGPGSSFAGRGTTGGAINIVTKEAQQEKSFYNMDTTFGTDATKRIVLDVNQIVTPTFAVRAGGMFQDADVAGRNYVTDDRSGGFIATKWTPTDAIKITTDYVHTDLHGIPDFGVPYYRPGAGTSSSNQQFTSTAGAPYPDVGVNRNNFYGFIYRDFFQVQQDIGTVNTEVKLTPDLTFNDKVRVSHSLNNYIGTLPESPSAPIPLSAATFTANPQSRYQTTDVLANQSELTYKFNTGDFKHTLLGGVEVDRETSSIDKYQGFNSELVTGVPFNGSGSVAGQSVFNPSYNFTPFGSAATLLGKPTNLAIDTASGYVLDSVNYRDLVILNGGVRVDDYRLNTSGFGTGALANTFGTQSAEFTMPNFNLGITLKPLPYASVYAAYATSSNPVGAEFDGTSTAYGGVAPVLANSPNQIFGPEKNQAIELGTKWELFNRHLLLTGALFQTNKENAREAYNVSTAATATANCPYMGVTASCIIAGSEYYVRGIDLEAAGKITDKWSIFGGLVLMQSQVTKSNVPPAAMPQPLLYSTNVGLPLANVAHQSFSLLSKYQLTDMWELGGQAVYRSQIYGGQLLAANEGTSIPSYWKFDAFVEAKIDKNWRVKLYVNNITNKLYYDALYQSAAPFVLEAPGRAAYIVVSARY
ncbi:TonB-dependent receptor [Bradyrhizobium erythrophlei]|uniref:Catecholate siderophore receptor n=1 Tax=Bradyrhizobium erythrophlei TaxID=1437360 RepID=A0A1M7U9J8_9BRAD|nr:TonB-dependent receptor [Bradyrhizobium erythrophlei]SHN79643.1 catecholate siderophore receptor [Bradyrhizobium erythrophlei]